MYRVGVKASCLPSPSLLCVLLFSLTHCCCFVFHAAASSEGEGSPAEQREGEEGRTEVPSAEQGEGEGERTVVPPAEQREGEGERTVVPPAEQREGEEGERTEVPEPEGEGEKEIIKVEDSSKTSQDDANTGTTESSSQEVDTNPPPEEQEVGSSRQEVDVPSGGDGDEMQADNISLDLRTEGHRSKEEPAKLTEPSSASDTRDEL